MNWFQNKFNIIVRKMSSRKKDDKKSKKNDKDKEKERMEMEERQR